MITYVTPGGYTYVICNKLLDATHVLIAGTTGSGKSVLINDIMLSVITRKTPISANLVLIDPKRVELSKYKDLPFTQRYAQEPHEAVRVLGDVIAVMENRYKRMEKDHVMTWSGCALYVVIDELADLMISSFRNMIKQRLQRILQLGRAAGIHVIAATQAPNRKIIPAELVLNFTDRVALRCLSPIESRQIIGINGAECLPRYGEALYQSSDGYKRIGIPLVPEADLQERINHWKRYA